MISLKRFMKVGSVIVGLMVSVFTVSSAANPDNLYGRHAEGKNGVVAAANPEASKIGVEVMKKGGNAVDAAVATAFAISVFEPNASGIGGGGFMLIRMAKTGKTVVIDYREKAPAKATPDMFVLDENGKVVNDEITVGGKASGVPGTVAGLLTALEKYGTMKRADVMAPAIKHAGEGIIVSKNLEGIIQDNYEKLVKFDAASEVYLKDGLPYEAGDRLVNKDLAATLTKISKEGKKAFYEGEIAKKIADEVQKQGGLMTVEDLKNYTIEEREPVVGKYRDYTIISCPPASSGGTHIVQLLNMVENYDLKAMGDNTPESWHIWAESMKQAFADRAEYMGDTAYVKVPLKGLTSKEYAKEVVKKIDLEKAGKDIKIGDPSKYESGSTTHFSVMDKDGNMVAVTQTINYFFGSGVVVPGTGIMMNNEMDDFVPQKNMKNSIEGGKRPLSSMSPTLVLDPKNRPLMTIGSPGATRIIPAVALTISNVIDHGMTLQEAINAPRIAQFQSGKLNAEGRMSFESYNKLQEMGHEINMRGTYDNYFGGVQGIMMDYDTKTLQGGADPRRDGQAAAF
ncbi:gamma-glutamyltransferase [Fusobacterium ulcerans]|jgi:gamma-glutamyltranspeptidase/glutathione hydrolase|uniref:Glutathione hydrolase proenzyme n=2 Tax=Fusobacterium ulcerans TaxID=861 RepID=A0AAX1TPK4_9FUSO|nr:MULTISPECIES: gamma-glutamyltransferase [Fusobacterium]AVQ28407.1 gamma-glutamyltransferase [Fusobacterium ulcerans]EFS25870.1 gamma-glutamyltransferase [Fusobacterium ulcerans ATCC 49185]EHO78459.1 gamma-glutamyltransferase [Fusobacterium ulcerans 12-1B]MDH6458926.1 gamma-glutamyltranspeptidase/glutathione hydrolase [Fusobacterium sp. PH5-7]MEE0137916.1 gamma-glutamyltransferase [Fusobacterium ulcerans]